MKKVCQLFPVRHGSYFSQACDKVGVLDGFPNQCNWHHDIADILLRMAIDILNLTLIILHEYGRETWFDFKTVLIT